MNLPSVRSLISFSPRVFFLPRLGSAAMYIGGCWPQSEIVSSLLFAGLDITAEEQAGLVRQASVVTSNT